MKLLICNTYSQLIIAIQLKLTLFKHNKVDLWITDHSNNVEKIIEPLNRTGLFNNVIFLQDKKFVYERNKIESFKDAIEYSFGEKKWDIEMYDEIVFYSLSLMLYSIADYYRIINHHVIWSRMEEGIFSYETDFESGYRIKLARAMRNISRRIEIANEIVNYYCFFPELKISHLDWNIIKIPSLNETLDLIVPLFSQIFKCRNETCRQKYIFFASSSDIEGKPCGEMELILKTADIVGKENLIVKMHPRDKRSVCLDNGIEVMENSWIPWEVSQLIGQYEDKIMLTVNSGAFITVSALQGGNGLGMFLYPSIKNKNKSFLKREKEIDKTLHRLHKNHICLGIKACTIDNIPNIN